MLDDLKEEESDNREIITWKHRNRSIGPADTKDERAGLLLHPRDRQSLLVIEDWKRTELS